MLQAIPCAELNRHSAFCLKVLDGARAINTLMAHGCGARAGFLMSLSEASRALLCPRHLGHFSSRPRPPKLRAKCFGTCRGGARWQASFEMFGQGSGQPEKVMKRTLPKPLERRAERQPLEDVD